MLSPVVFLRCLATLVPPPGVHLVRFFGVLAPNAHRLKLGGDSIRKAEGLTGGKKPAK